MGAVPFFGVDIGYIHDCKGGEGACGTGLELFDSPQS